ncbi:MAG: hypothetical protein HND44_23305 [Chloroflexi bacterium]|nr:hypothetical protein [Ardenticatenaceae bacterium]MBL1131368.1 hypothetical protein [Chloroflexota bacterium]NOG37471.1 hypothetical protein [Chloroflexota bacterium]
MITEDPIRWSVKDRYGSEIYLTHERWQHIIEPINHPEMTDFEDHLRATIRQGQRKQDGLNPQKYRYSLAFDDLVEDNTHIVAIVLFRFRVGQAGELLPNNFIVTAYQKEVW